MPKVVAHDERRRDIARSAWRVIARDGLDGLTTRSVAREAGWSTGVLAHYFENRTDLVLAAFSLVADDVEARVNVRLEHQDDPIERVWITVSEGATLDDTRLTEARVWFTFIGLAAGIPELRKEVEDRYGIWYGLIEPELVRAGVPRRQAPKVARRMIAMVDGFAVQAMFDPETLSARQIGAELRRFVESCIDEARALRRVEGRASPARSSGRYATAAGHTRTRIDESRYRASSQLTGFPGSRERTRRDRRTP